jgi:CheY-like chemotaxis protein
MNRPLLLLVDDAREMGLIVRHLGTRAGYEVEHRLDAESARAFLQERRPDLLLLDVNLPGASGPDLCRQVRAEPRLADLPVALFTREDLVEDVAAGLDAGANFLVCKDLVGTPEAWSARLSEILEVVRSQRNGAPLRSDRDETGICVPRDWIASLNRVLRPPILRRLAPPVVRALLRRSLSQVFERTNTDCWLTTDGCGLDPARVPECVGRSAVVLAAVLADQVWCVAGNAEGDLFRAALATAFPGFLELQADR